MCSRLLIKKKKILARLNFEVYMIQLIRITLLPLQILLLVRDFGLLQWKPKVKEFNSK